MSAIRTHAKNAALTGRPRVQTQWVWGKRERRRWAIFGVKYLLFLALPWISVGGAPALFFDIPSRQYHAFGQVFWPQDFYMLGLMLALAALLLFITTSLVGRIFCGFACPHTLLTSLFMQLDHWIEGDRPKRLAMDGGKWTPEARVRRVLKHMAWFAVAGWLGFTFVSYFVGAHELLHRIASFSLGGWPLAVWGFISAITYMFAGHLRDWVCVTVCPYGRFQGAMQDVDSLLVTYDAVRGEPRGKSKEVRERQGCVDCGMCVTACPMNIDIRQGPQYECISCMRCIDACDKTMAALGAEPNLIRMASQREWEARVEAPEKAMPQLRERRWWRPRYVWYAAVLAALVGVIGTGVATRQLLGIEANRDRTRMIRLADGRVSNLYQLKLLNKDTRPHKLRVELEGLSGELRLGVNPLVLDSGAMRQLNAAVVLGGGLGDRPVPFKFRLLDAETGQVKALADATFVGPLKQQAIAR